MVSFGQDWQGAVKGQFLALFLPVEPVYKVDAFDSLHLRSHLHHLIQHSNGLPHRIRG